MKKIYLLSLLMLLPLVASADVEINGIYYYLRSSGESKTAIVSLNPNKYSGDIVIPKSVTYNEVIYIVTSIEVSAFFECTELTSVTIPESVSTIGENAFSGCSSLTSVTIGSGVTTINKSAFKNCGALTAVNISDLKAWCNITFGYNGWDTSTMSNPLSYAHHLYLNDQEIIDLVIPDGVTAIGNYAFYGCSEITSVTIPGSVTSIGYGVFEGCDALNAVKIADVGAWCNTSFGDNPLGIAQHLYVNGEEVVDLVIPEGTKAIEANAFGGCRSIKSVKIPNSVTNIKSGAFDGCEALTAVHVSDIGEWCNIFFEGNSHDGSNPLTFAHHLFMDGVEVRNLVIPGNATSISDELFKGCSELTSVKIEEGATFIGNSAFSDCINIKTVEIPNSVTEIGNSAFNGCKSITTMSLGSGINSIGERAFYGCSGLITMTIPKGVKAINYCTFTCCTSLLSVDIPEGVETIGGSAFSSCSSLISANIPQTVKSIDGYAFAKCKNMKDIIIPEGVSTINEYTFEDCFGLRSVTIPKSVSSIKVHAFIGCRGLEEVRISDINAWCNIVFDTDYINYCNPLAQAHHLYLNGEEVKDLIIPESVTSLTKGIFYGASGLTSVSFPSNMTSISEYAFYGCSGLTSITLPEDLTVIKGNAFQNCSNIESISIPSKVEYIYQEAFAGCGNLKSVKSLAATPPFLYDNSFSNYEIPLYVPEVSIDNYKAADGWKKFKEVLSVNAAKYTLTYKVDGEVYKTYEVYEGAAITPEPAPTKEGYDFSGWSTIPATMPAENVTVTGTFSLITDEDEITIKEIGKTTWCSKYDLDFTNVAGIKAYIAIGYDDIDKTIWLARVMKVPAGTGLLVKGDAGTYKIPHANVRSTYVNYLKGNLGETIKIEETDGDKTNYYLSGKDGTFVSVSGNANIGKNKAYLQLPTSIFAGTRSIGISYDDEDGTTGINVQSSMFNVQSDAYYNLQGQRVQNPGKGLYIKNGRKVVIK